MSDLVYTLDNLITINTSDNVKLYYPYTILKKCKVIRKIYKYNKNNEIDIPFPSNMVDVFLSYLETEIITKNMMELSKIDINIMCKNIACIADYLSWDRSNMYSGHNSKFGSDKKGDFIIYFSETFDGYGLNFDFIVKYLKIQ